MYKPFPGATDPIWVQVMACVTSVTTPTPTPTSSVTSSPGLDPRFPTSAAAKAAG